MSHTDLVEAYPPARWEAAVSLPANLTTAMVLVDYARQGQATPSPWPYHLLRLLPEPDLDLLRNLRALLAHGTNLRDFLLMRIAPESPAHKDWASLLRWLENLSQADLTELVTRGILSGLEFYHEQMQPDPQVEVLLERLGSRTPDPALLLEPKYRRIGMEALLTSWGEQESPQAACLAERPGELHEAVIRALTAMWHHGFEEAWEATRAGLEAAVQGHSAGSGAHLAPSADTTENLLLRITGLQPPASSVAPLRSAGRVLFVPCLHLGQYLTVARADYGWKPAVPGQDLYHVFYEPAALRAPAHSPGSPAHPAAEAMDLAALGPTLEALGDPTRMAILQLLRYQGEMVAGQVAEALGVHPSTVSRQFAPLEAAKLVHVRREANVKYYTLDREQVRAVARLLEQHLG